MPYTVRASDYLFERMEEFVSYAIAGNISPEETFEMLDQAWQYAIDNLKKDVVKSRNRWYTQYSDNKVHNRPEPKQDSEPDRAYVPNAFLIRREYPDVLKGGKINVKD